MLRRIVRVVERRHRVAFGAKPVAQQRRLCLLARTIAALDDEDAPRALGRRGKGVDESLGLVVVRVLGRREQRVLRQPGRELPALAPTPQAQDGHAPAVQCIHDLGADGGVGPAEVGDDELGLVDGAQQQRGARGGRLRRSQLCGGSLLDCERRAHAIVAAVLGERGAQATE